MNMPLLLSCVVLLTVGGMLGCAAPGSPGEWSTAVGQDWSLVKISGQAPIHGTHPTLTFSNDGRVVGHAGANRFFGTFAADDDGSLTLSALGTTRMHRADPPGVMEQESAYLNLLSSVTRYRVANDTLTLFAGRKAVLRYENSHAAD